MQPTIRSFTTGDYPELIGVINAATPESAFTLDSFLAREQRRDPKCRYGRWVAVDDTGQLVGMGEYGQRVELYHPRRFYMNLFVIPEWQGTGMREKLYETVMGVVESLSPEAVRASAYEARPEEMAFWQSKGFMEVMRNGEAHIDPNTVNFDRYADADRRFTEAGFRIAPITQLTDDPDRDDKLCALHNLVMRDVPPIGERSMLDRETFIRVRLNPPDVLHHSYLIALSPEGEYVGMTQYRTAMDGNPTALETGLTGVHPAWRRRGIGLAIKLHALREAKARGYTLVRTTNAAQNEPILALNRQMGYIRSPWHIHYLKTWEGTAE